MYDHNIIHENMRSVYFDTIYVIRVLEMGHNFQLILQNVAYHISNFAYHAQKNCKFCNGDKVRRFLHAFWENAYRLTEIYPISFYVYTIYNRNDTYTRKYEVRLVCLLLITHLC